MAEWQECFDSTCAVACTAWAAAMVIAPAPDPEDNEPRLYDANGWEEFVLYALFEEDDELLFRHPWWTEHIYEIQNETKFLCILRRVIYDNQWKSRNSIYASEQSDHLEKSLKSSDTASIGLRKKKKREFVPHVQGVLLERQSSLSYSAIKGQMQLLCPCLHNPNLRWNDADYCNHQEEIKSLTVHLYCFWRKTIFIPKNYKSIYDQTTNLQNYSFNATQNSMAIYRLTAANTLFATSCEVPSREK